MKNKTLITILSIAAVAGIGIYFFSRMKKKGEQKAEEIKQEGEILDMTQPSQTTTPIISGNPWQNIANTISNFLSNYNDYTVTTQTSGLNLREKPDAKSKILASIPKGSTVKAKASEVKGWFIVSKDGVNPSGFVASQFLKAKQSK
jgi:uncharacterized protein YgiM (DUF1202 family)